MKVRIGFGLPDIHLLTTSRIARGMEVWKTPHNRAELWLPKGLYYAELEALDEKENFQHIQDDFLAFTKFEKKDEWHFGGTLRRRVSVAKMRPHLDDDILCHHSWEEILGPILPWEAWRSCREWNMALQGIMIHTNLGFWRFYLVGGDPEELDFSLKSYDKDGEEICDHTKDLRLVHERMFKVEPEDPELVEYPKIYVTDSVTSKMIEFCLALNQMVPAGNERGWSVAGVWRIGDAILERQAELFEMTRNQLLTRLQRRERASKKGRSRDGTA